ncbi:MAG: DUF2889 domain-containing protein [Sulfuricaulis sp.]|nr:DUF2889 domain-containing protein [Sulfuricaulis sp.]
MNFSQPIERELLHSRRIHCDGYLRSDGLWDLDAHVLDTRSFESQSFRGPNLPAHEALHRMGMRVTIGNDMVIRAVEALTERGPYPDCLTIAVVYKDLVGMKIGPGFLLAVKQRFRGRQGCTHLSELLGPLATTAMQTLRGHASRNKAVSNPVPVHDDKPHPIVNSCHAFRSDGEVVLMRWPRFYTGPAR